MSIALQYGFPIGGVQILRQNAGGAGTVTSVGLSLPGLFSVTGSPITGAGTLSASLVTQSANAVFAGPTSGGAAAPAFRAIVAADLGTGTANSTTFLRGDMTWATPGGGGTVTSVGLSLPSIFSVTGSPVTGSGTLSATLSTQSANAVFAGPTSGGAAAPAFRAIVAADIGSGTADSTTFLRGDMTWATPGGGGTVTSVGLSLPSIFSVTGSPVTGSGTLSATLSTQSANAVFAGPTSGGAATPSFRSIVAADLGTGTANSTTFLRGDMTWAAITMTPAGSTTHIQYNNAGAFAGSSLFTFDGTTIGINGAPVGTSRVNIATSSMTALTVASSVSAGYTIVATQSATTTNSGSLSLANTGTTGGTRTLNVTNASSNSSAYGIYVDMTHATPAGTGLYVQGNLSKAAIEAYNASGSGYAGRFGMGGAGIQRVLMISSATASANGIVGDGAALVFAARSSTAANTEQATIHSVWTDASHVTRTADLVFSCVVSTTSTELMRLLSNGTLRVGTGSVYFGLKPAGSGTPVWTMPSADGSADQVLKTDGAGNLGWATVGGTGTVTSVAMTAPIEFVVGGSPITTSGTLALSWDNQTANKVLASPSSGGPASPAFRSLVADDIPALDAAKIASGTIATARLGSGTASASTFLRGDQTWAVPSVTTVSDSTFRIQDNGDTTKQIAFEASSIATATTRTITMPNRDVTLDTLTVGTTLVSGGSASRLLQQDASGFFSYQPNLSYASGRLGIRSDGAVGSAGQVDIQVNGANEPALYVRNYRTNLTQATPALDLIIDNSAEFDDYHFPLRITTNSNSAGTSDYFGTGIAFRAETSTTASTDIGDIRFIWTTATHTTRASQLMFSLRHEGSRRGPLQLDSTGLVTTRVYTDVVNDLTTGITVAMDRTSLSPPAVGMGIRTEYLLESSATYDQQAAFTFVRWTDPTDATRQAMFGICVYEGTGLSGSSTSPNFAVSGGGTWTQNQNTATTNAVVTAWTRTINSTGTPAANFGLRDLIQLDTNATPGVSAAAFDTTWIDAAAVSATSQFQIYLADSGALTERYRFLNGGLDIRNSSGRIYINGTQVVTTRQPGWSAATGTKTRSTFDPATVTTSQLGERVGALIDDLMTHGLI